MPFRSEAQRRFMFAKHPDIAERWSKEYGPKPIDLTKHAPKRKRRKVH